MDELQKLYDLLVREGKYTKSFDEFKVKWSGEQGYQDKVFDVVSKDGFYTKDKGSFISKYGMTEEKKNIQSTSAVAPTALPLEDGSLESAPTEKLMVGPMGMTGIERTKDYVSPKEQGKQGTLLNTISSLDKGFYKNLIGSPVKGLGTALEGVTGKGFVSDALIKFGDYFNKTIDELTSQDEEFKNSLTDQFGQAFGQVASLVVTGGASGAAGKAGAAAELAAQVAPKGSAAVGAIKGVVSELASPTAVSAGLSMGQSEFERAKEAGATDEQAFEAFYKNAAVGSVLEKIPVMQFLKRFEKASAGGISNYIKTKGVAGLVGGVEEMTTEVLQGIYSNLAAQDIYNVNQQLFEGIGEAGGVGFGVGFLLNAMGANVKILRSQGRDAEADIIENQMAQFESKVESKPAPIYKVNGVKVELPAINDIIDNTSAADLTKLNIDIENDVELRDRLQDKIVTSSIMEQVREANPDLNEPSLKAITELEKQLQKLEGNKTQSGKDKAAAVREQIKTIQENPLTEDVVAESATTLEQELRANLPYEYYEGNLNSEYDWQRNTAKEFLADPKAYFERMIESAKEGLQADPNDQISKNVLADNTEKLRLFNEITNKYTTNAIQEQGTATGVPSTEQPQLGLQEMGEGNAQPKGTPPGTQEVVAPEPGQEKVAPAVEPETEVSSKTQPDEEPKIKVFRGQGKNMGSGVNEGFNWVSSSSDVASDFGNVSELEIPKPQKTYKFPWARTSQPITGDQLINAINNAITKAVKEKSITQSQYKSINEKKKLLSTLIDNKIESFQSKVNDPKSSRLVADIFSDLGYDALEVNDDGITNYGLIKSSQTTQPAAEVAPVVTTETATITAPEVVAEPVVEPVVEEETVEQYEPITVKDTSYEPFTKYNATDYEEGEREADNGRTYTYLASITIPVMDADGNTIGYLKKLVSEDDELSFNAENLDGEDLDLDGYETLGQAKQALVDNYNKTKKKEFDKEAKKAAKQKVKEAEKAAKKAETKAAKEATKAAKAAAKAATTTTTEAPAATDTLEDLLDVDVSTTDGMQTVLDALNKADKAISDRLRGGANDALLAIPLSTVQLVVKTLKTLVKGGMILRDAIKKVAADNSVSQQIVKDILNISEIQDKFDALMLKVDEMVNRQRARGTAQDRMVSNIDTYVRKSEVYQEANDAQKKILEREARARAGAAERRAPSIGRILGVLKDITNVSREDKLKIISQIRQLSKGAAQELANEIRELAKSGKITVNQAANIVSRFGKVNMLSEISVSKFVDYMTKVFNDADYANKLSIGNSLKKDLSKLSKNKEKNANLRDLAKEFVKINPSMVDDIDAYNEMASRIKEAIVGSKIKGENVSFAATVDIKDATVYINKTLAIQLEKLRQEKIAQIQELMGIDASTFSYDDMMMLLEKGKPITKYNEGIIRDTINNMFDVFSSMIDKTISTGKDVFTGEDVVFTESQKDVVKRFMDMDLNNLQPKEALEAVDALANFLQNQSTAKMESVVSKYNGIIGAKQLKSKGIKAFPLKKYWSKILGRVLGEQTTNLNVLFERMFKGFTAGGMVMDKMGLTKLINKKASAQTEANNIVDRFVELFYDKKANGEDFNSSYNNTERGMAAFMMRNVIGTEEEMKAEFKRRKELLFKVEDDGTISGSIAVLEKGNDKEKAKAELYKKAYDKILADSNTIEEVKKKTDKVNLEGIKFWMDEWNNKYDQLSEVSENVYNKKLDKDINYTPDRFFTLSTDTGIIEISNSESAFLVNSGTNDLYQRETGVLMEAVRPESLPKGRYIDLSFDNNNANSMYDALVDINTAAPIRQIEAFLNSDDFESVFPNSDDAKIIKGSKGRPGRIDMYIRNIRNKNPYSNDELASTVKKLNKIASIGVGQALGGITQPFKQVIPVMLNTIVNAGGIDLSATFNKAKNDFISKSGYSIANRGIESQAQVESLNRLVDEVSKSKGEKLLNGIEKLNKKWLDTFLVKPDVFIARASWLSYYEQYLQKQGTDTKGIDYNTHKLNEDAANYAQRMVDRQQNVSDSDLAGKFFASRESANQLLVKTIMPFASFRMNQASRVGADLATLTNKTSSSEDKRIAAKSLAGYGIETATFRLVSIGISVLLGSLAKAIMGIDEDDEEYEKRVDNIIKGAKTGTFTDIFSPLPIADKPIQELGASVMQSIEDATGLPTAIYSPRMEEYFQSAGLFGISLERLRQLKEIVSLSVTGKYTDDFGKEKTISSNSQDALKMLIVPALMTNVGLAPSEVNTIVRYGIKDAKKKTKSETEKMQSAETKKVREESKNQKIEALNNLRQKTQDQELRSAINDKIRELKANDEQKIEMKEENAREKEIKKKLLVDTKTGEEYDTESELKRYNKPLWDKNFGPDSEWYKSHEDEDEVTKLLNKEIRRMEDEEYGYTPKTRRKKSSFGGGGFGQGKKRTGFGAQNKKGSGFGPQ